MPRSKPAKRTVDTVAAETVIVGGGIIGLSLAFELLARGQPVRVLLSEAHPGMATMTAAGMLAPVSEADVEHPDLVPLALDSLARYPAFVARVEDVSGLACGYRQEGLLWIGLHRDHRAEIDHLQTFMAERGLTAERLDARSLRRLEPHLSPRVVTGCRVPGDHQVDPRALRNALLVAIERLGGALQPEAHACGAEVAHGRLSGLHIEHPDGTRSMLPCESAVLANGAWLGGEFEACLPDCGMRPVKGQVLRLRGAPLLQHVVRTPDVYLVPRADGRLIVGASSEEMGFDTRATTGATYDLLRHAIDVLPEVAELELEEVSVGLRPATSDHLPVIGATQISGLYLNGGHFRNGVLLAPGSAWHLAEALVTGTPGPMLAPFHPRRFEHPT